jgi:DNA-binding GntR family transcriptional regulator
MVKEPIYQQLNNHLRALITSGEDAAGTQFLTERQICERFGTLTASSSG